MYNYYKDEQIKKQKILDKIEIEEKKLFEDKHRSNNK